MLPADSAQDRVPISDVLAIRELVAMNERVLQSVIVEPLLRRMGFRNVYDTSGPQEHGKDLIATKPDEFGRVILCAIQIKKFKPSAAVGSGQSFGQLLDQLRQALEEPVIDPATNRMRAPDYCVFVTPYAVPPQVRQAFHARMSDPLFRLLRIVDGPQLIEQIRQHMPDAITRFSMETQYRIHVAQEANRIPESSVAFELRDDLELDNIYVDVSLGQDVPMLERIAFKRFGRKKLIVNAFERDMKVLRRHYRVWAARPASDQAWSKKKRGAYLWDVDLNVMFRAVRDRLKSYLEDLNRLANSDAKHCTEIAIKGIRIKRDLDRLTRVSVVKENWSALRGSPSKDRGPLVMVPTSAILKIRLPVYLIGGPGSGKTTLLRRICQSIARYHKSELPLFVPLISVNEPSYSGLLGACKAELQMRGYRTHSEPLNDFQFISLLNGGHFCLCLDGLDEAGSKAHALLQVIDQLAVKHPKCRVVLTSRDTFDSLGWDRAFTLRLEPFSDEQLSTFVEQWFSSQPSARKQLVQWLAENEQMKAAARTPLVAALLCSLFQAQADLPSTESELYERRFELLLGRWEQAKRLQTLAPQIRKRYFYFLMAFAFHLHGEERRSATNEEATGFASKYYVKRFHLTPTTMVHDCVQRGLLEREESGALSFGHLTYQEYLCGEWLAHQNPVGFIWSKLLDPWWHKVLNFYAARKLDITPLVRHGLRERRNRVLLERVCALAKFAPMTADVVMLKFRAGPFKSMTESP